MPASPADGQRIFYVADATNGVIWHLRYRSGSASTYKWEFLGGPPLYAEVQTGEATTSTTYADLATLGPGVTVPLAGDYNVEIGCQASISTLTAAAIMSYAIGGTAASDDDQIRVRSPDATGSNNLGATVARTRRKTALAASTLLRAKYKASSGTGTFTYRWMRVVPVRVG